MALKKNKNTRNQVVVYNDGTGERVVRPAYENKIYGIIVQVKGRIVLGRVR